MAREARLARSVGVSEGLASVFPGTSGAGLKVPKSCVVTSATMARHHPYTQPPFPSLFCSSLAWHSALGQVPAQLAHWCRAELGGAGRFGGNRMGFPSDGLSSGEEPRMGCWHLSLK